MLDIFLLPVAIPGRHISMLGRNEIYEYPVIGPMFSKWDSIPIDRDDYGRETYEAVKGRLAVGRLVGVFPGKTRTRGVTVGKFDPAFAGVSHVCPSTNNPGSNFRSRRCIQPLT